MCDASMGHVRRIRGPQAAGSTNRVRRLHGPCATAPWATGGWQAAVRHDTVVSRRRRRHATAASSDFFCVPFGGARQRARLPTVLKTPVARFDSEWEGRRRREERRAAAEQRAAVQRFLLEEEERTAMALAPKPLAPRPAVLAAEPLSPRPAELGAAPPQPTARPKGAPPVSTTKSVVAAVPAAPWLGAAPAEPASDACTGAMACRGTTATTADEAQEASEDEAPTPPRAAAGMLARSTPPKAFARSMRSRFLLTRRRRRAYSVPPFVEGVVVRTCMPPFVEGVAHDGTKPLDAQDAQASNADADSEDHSFARCAASAFDEPAPAPDLAPYARAAVGAHRGARAGADVRRPVCPTRRAPCRAHGVVDGRAHRRSG